jgi:hypothetical protein
MTQMAELTAQLLTRGRQIKFTPEKVQQISNLVERGTSREEIAELLGVTVGSLQVTCSRLGISLRRPKLNNGIRLLRPSRAVSTFGMTMDDPSRDASVPLQPTQQNSQSGPAGHVQATTPQHHERTKRTNEADSANFAIRMHYKGEERTTELPLTQDMVRQLALEASFRDLRIGELVGELIIATLKKDLFQLVLKPDQIQISSIHGCIVQMNACGRDVGS